MSSQDPKNDLDRQDAVLSGNSQSQGWNYEVIRDLGSGMNYRKKGLNKLITAILDGDVARLVITHKDRLLRFGSELIFAFCSDHDIEVIILNQKEYSTFEEDLASDVKRDNYCVFCAYSTVQGQIKIKNS